VFRRASSQAGARAGVTGECRYDMAGWQACGRYASVASQAELLERFVVDAQNADELRGQDFNVTPTKDNPAVIARVPGGRWRRCGSGT
jgi:hypothetical protein